MRVRVLKNVYQFVIDEFLLPGIRRLTTVERTEATGDNFGRANKRAAMHFLAKTYLAREAMKHLPTAMTSPMQPCVPRKP